MSAQFKSVQSVFSMIIILTLVLSGIQPSPVAAQGGDDGVKREVNAETGKVSFIGPENGRTLLSSQVLGTSTRPADPALALAKRFAPEFGIQNPERDLTATRSQETDEGRVTVRYQQNYEGIPVMGGELIVNTNENGDLYSMNGEVSPNLSLSTQPEIDSNQAQETALQAIAKWYQASKDDFVVSDPELWIFDESLLKPSARPAELVWRMEVSSKDNSQPVRELVVVNAQRGSISLHFNQIDNAWGAPNNTEVARPDVATPKITDSKVKTSSTKTTKDPMPNLLGATWYVATTGDDSNDCATTSTPCATINGAIGKADSGDTINVATGTYTGTGTEVALINNSVTILGGWDPPFTNQNGHSTIDGQDARRGITISGFVAVHIERFIVHNGFADSGGGIANNFGTLTLSESVITDNTSSVVGGGIGNGGTLALNNSIVSINTATSGGGGIFNSGDSESGGTVTLNNSTVNTNTASNGSGGGISNYGTLILNNSTISGNKVLSTFNGGGIFNYWHDVIINNSTISYNTSNSSSGGIINYSGTVTIRNTILANNTASESGHNCSGIITSLGYNLIGDNFGCTFSSTTGDQIGTANSPIDAQLGLLIGSPAYHPLYLGSPAINKGNPGGCMGSFGILATDQRGAARVGRCDIGAYEYTVPGIAVSFGYVSGSSQQTRVGHPFAYPFVVYVVDSQGNLVSGINVVFTAPSTGVGGIFAKTNTNTATIQTDVNGMATAPVFTANSLEGSYTVNASVNGLSGSASFTLINKPLSPPKISTYTANNTQSLPGTLLCDQTKPTCPSGDNHAKKAHQYAIGVYNLYATKHFRDSIDDNGMIIKSTVHYKNNYDNAFWNGKQMVYGDANGYPLADDIVAHELTHGVTQYESGLFYYYQSGAIDESLADLWGEYYDQTNGLGNDANNVKWLLGEDVTGLGAFRNMKNPPQFSHPDKMSSPNYYEGLDDSGGVHTNSGVNNKAVYLMVNGGTFNGKTITKLGWTKTAAIYYEANTNLLTSGSDYSDLYFALQQACSNLIGQKGITSADCVQVKNALLAVEMNAQPASNFNPEAAVCPTGLTTGDSLSLYKDEFENGSTQWTPQPAWSLEDWYATSPTHMFYGDDAQTSSDSSLKMKTRVTLPAGSQAFLHFKHAFLFDYLLYQGQNYYFDGGVLEYSINNGTTWKDAKPLFSAGQDYKGVIYNYSGTTNKLKGRSAFVGDSHGYVSSRYDLSSLAGKKVQFRWRLATDSTVAFLGWFVDDVQIYTCIGKPSKPVLSSPATNALVTDYTPDLDWFDSTPVPVTYQIQIADNDKFTSPAYSQKNLPTSDFTVPADLTPNTKYYWRVRAINALNKPGAWSTAFTFRTVMVPPVLLTPTDGEAITTLQPLLDWEDTAGATKYVVQVWDASDPSTKLVDLNSLTESDYQIPSDLPAGATIRWRVRALGPNGPSAWSTIFSFVTP